MSQKHRGHARRLTECVGIAAFALAAASQAADSDDARAVVEQLFQALTETAALEPAPDQAERYAALEPAIVESFDLARMGQLAAGRYWNRWSETEQQAYLAAFERLSVTQHVSNFASLTPEVYAIVDSEPAEGSDMMKVGVVIERSNDDEDVTLDYMLESDGQGWQIVNVIRMGISSEISALRSDYHAILTDSGLDGLLDELESQIERCNTSGCYDR